MPNCKGYRWSAFFSPFCSNNLRFEISFSCVVPMAWYTTLYIAYKPIARSFSFPKGEFEWSLLNLMPRKSSRSLNYGMPSRNTRCEVKGTNVWVVGSVIIKPSFKRHLLKPPYIWKLRAEMIRHLASNFVVVSRRCSILAWGEMESRNHWCVFNINKRYRAMCWTVTFPSEVNRS